VQGRRTSLTSVQESLLHTPSEASTSQRWADVSSVTVMSQALVNKPLSFHFTSPIVLQHANVNKNIADASSNTSAGVPGHGDAGRKHPIFSVGVRHTATHRDDSVHFLRQVGFVVLRQLGDASGLSKGSKTRQKM
jgi:hypothetical protein